MKLLVALSLCVLMAACSMARAANPYLNAKDDQPQSASFSGTEWGDEIGDKKLPLTAKVVTTRLAKMEWGAVYKVSFESIASKAEKPRELTPLYFLATDSEILLLNEEDMDKAIQKISEMKKPPEHEKDDVRALSKGRLKFKSGPYETEIAVKGDLCTYHSSHNSGHYSTFVWKKGAGLVEYASNRGAESDGYHLKRDAKKE